jgi:hypothetical protein
MTPLARLPRLPEPAVGVLVGVGLCALFVPLALGRLIDMDEGPYLIAARLVMEGKLPYHDFFYPQMPLLPYVYGLWMALFGHSWDGARVLSALLAAGVGVLLYHHVQRLTGRRAYGLVAAVMLGTSSLVFGWYPAVKTYAFAVLTMFAAYAVLFLEHLPRRHLLSGLLLALAIDVRLYLVAVVPAFLLDLALDRVRGAGWAPLRNFGAGLAIGLLPTLAFAVIDPDVFLFNVLHYHGLRDGAPLGLVARFDQKGAIFSQLIGFDGVRGVAGAQFLLLLLLLAALAVMSARARVRVPLAATVAASVIVVSFVPTPTYVQYQCLAVPFMVVAALLFLHRLETTLPPESGRRAMGWVLALVCAFHVSAGSVDLLRYAAGHPVVPSIYRYPSPVDWRIATIREIGRVIDAHARPGADAVVTWWPGYLIETRASILPGMENQFNSWLAHLLTPAQVERYRYIAPVQVAGHIASRRSDVVVVGNFMLDGGAWYRRVLADSGYTLVRKIGNAEVYASPQGAR